MSDRIHYRKGFGPSDGDYAVMTDCEIITMHEARIAQLEAEVAWLREALRLAILNLGKMPTWALGTAYRDSIYIPRVGRGRVEAIIDAESTKVEVLPELIRNLRQALQKTADERD